MLLESWRKNWVISLEATLYVSVYIESSSISERGINPWRVVSIVGIFWKGCWCWRDEWAVS